jgi:hypothetical protein
VTTPVINFSPVTTIPLKTFFPGVVDTGQKYPKSLKFIAGYNDTAKNCSLVPTKPPINFLTVSTTPLTRQS